MIDDKSKSDPE